MADLTCKLHLGTASYPGLLRFIMITSHSFRARFCHVKNEAPEEEADLGIYLVTRSDKYEGAKPFRHLKVVQRILKVMRCSIGSQCSSCNTGDICSCLGVSATILAAAF